MVKGIGIEMMPESFPVRLGAYIQLKAHQHVDAMAEMLYNA